MTSLLLISLFASSPHPSSQIPAHFKMASFGVYTMDCARTSLLLKSRLPLVFALLKYKIYISETNIAKGTGKCVVLLEAPLESNLSSTAESDHRTKMKSRLYGLGTSDACRFRFRHIVCISNRLIVFMHLHLFCSLNAHRWRVVEME